MGSDLPGLYKQSVEQRRASISDAAGLDPEVLEAMDPNRVDMDMLDGMAENVVGGFVLPIGVATNFLINGREVLVPMATEEPSVVAAASRIAKAARRSGGFRASCPGNVMIGQVQVIDVKDPAGAKAHLMGSKDAILREAAAVDPVLTENGGGPKDLQVRILGSPSGTMLIVHLFVDCLDAMGANAVNTMAESVTPTIESLTGGRVLLRILSNLAIERLAFAECTFDKEDLGGENVVRDIIKAYHLALVDPFRAATHNKGVMNGISAVVRATGNDTRAMEAGAHAYASFGGSYGPLTSYSIDVNGDLVGRISIPSAVGTVGGITKVHPAARASLALMKIKRSSELGEVLASVGLAQNLAALRALASEGIQKGHMKLHARNLAIQAGAGTDEIDEVVSLMVKQGKVTGSLAKEVLARIRDPAEIK